MEEDQKIHLHIDKKQSGCYASIYHSYRSGGMVKSKRVENIGKVIDLDKGIFQSRKRGIFCYSIQEGFSAAPEEYTGAKDKGDERLIIDFGESFFLNEYIKKQIFFPCIEDLYKDDKDTFMSLLFYRTYIRGQASSYAKDWWEGDYAKELFPNADLTGDNISKVLSEIGEEKIHRIFFESYLPIYCEDKRKKKDAEIRSQKRKEAQERKRLEKETGIKQPCPKKEKKEEHDDYYVIAAFMDTTGIENSVNMDATQTSNHNGVIKQETRVTYVVDQETGDPFYMRYTPGNVNDVSTLITTIVELRQYKIKINYVIMDAGYFSEKNITELYENKINFLTRIPKKRTIYKELSNKYLKEAHSPKYLVQYGSRYVYMMGVTVKLYDKYDAYAYIGIDIETCANGLIQTIGEIVDDHLSAEEADKRINELGLFIFISSDYLSEEEVLPRYYSRQRSEQNYDIAKNYASLYPIRVHSEKAFKGHLLISFLSSIINEKLQRETKKFKHPSSKVNGYGIWWKLHSQKAKVYKNAIVPQEAVKKQTEIYKMFHISVPYEIPRKS